MLLGVIGALLIWKPSPADRAGAKNVGGQASMSQAPMSQIPASVSAVSVTPAEDNASDKKPRGDYWQIEHWPRLIVLSGMLTVGAIMGWWSTEVLYTQQVIYSHDAQLSASETK